MKNLCVELGNHPGSLAEMGEILGRAGISIEGGATFVVNDKGVANSLFEDGRAAREALEAAGIRVLRESDGALQKLNQDEPGQLGKLLRRMAEAGVNVEVQYSDHQHQLVLVVNDLSRANSVSEVWRREQAAGGPSAVPLRPQARHSGTSWSETSKNPKPHIPVHPPKGSREPMIVWPQQPLALCTTAAQISAF